MNLKTLKILAMITFVAFNLAMTSPAQAATQKPKVVNTVPADIAELPRTGVPLIAWAAAALVPVGFKLRKKGSEKKEDQLKDDNPKNLWLKRQLDK